MPSLKTLYVFKRELIFFSLFSSTVTSTIASNAMTANSWNSHFRYGWWIARNGHVGLLCHFQAPTFQSRRGRPRQGKLSTCWPPLFPFPTPTFCAYPFQFSTRLRACRCLRTPRAREDFLSPHFSRNQR